MAEARNSNLMGLGEVINTDNLRQDKMQELDLLDMSIAPPSDYTELEAELFGSDGSTEETDSSVSSASTKKKQESSVESEDSESGSEESEEYESGESEVEFNDPVMSGIKGVVNLESTKKQDNDCKILTEVLNEIEKKKASMITQGIPVPHYNPKKAKKSLSYAKEALKVLSDNLEDNKCSDDIVSMLNFALKILCTIFNGRHEIAGYRIDLSGYNVAVIQDLKEMREETIELSSYIRKNIGKRVMKILRFIKIFIINAGVTIWNNNAKINSPDFGDDDDDDDDEETYESEEEEEED